MNLEKDRALSIIKAALKEDIGSGDITTSSVIDKHKSISARIVTRQECVICGLLVAEWTLAQIDYSVRFKPMLKDGDPAGASKAIAIIEGQAAGILRSERTILNFLTLLSAVATRTRRYVDKVRPYGVKIMDTRKTIPLLRYLEKYAVTTGGGHNHRMGLFDQVLIKDNHIRVQGRKDIANLIERARRSKPKGTTVEIEVEDLAEFKEALSAGPDIIMLDNMSPDDVKKCIEMRSHSDKRAMIEVSGGITIDNIEDYARCRPEMISIGTLTDSIKSIDMSLEID